MPEHPALCGSFRTIGIREGKTLTVVARHPLGGPVVVEVNGREVTLGRRMAQRVIVGEPA
ncbi:MAG: FeoA family protein [Methanoculleus sp.]